PYPLRITTVDFLTICGHAYNRTGEIELTAHRCNGHDAIWPRVFRSKRNGKRLSTSLSKGNKRRKKEAKSYRVGGLHCFSISPPCLFLCGFRFSCGDFVVVCGVLGWSDLGHL